MESTAKEFLHRLLMTPSPSGFEHRIQDVVREYARSFADSVRTDSHGNVIAAVNENAPVRAMLAGHCDQIGMLVCHIDDQGFLYAQTIGGWDPQQLIGQRMTIWTDGGPLPAVISRKAIHLMEPEERTKGVLEKDLWLDIGAKNGEEAKSLVRMGDPVTLQLGYAELRNDCLTSPGTDDKTGLWVVLEAARRANRSKLKCGIFAVSTVQEEIGLRGATTAAYGIDPHLGIAVDVTHATDCPTIDVKQRGVVKLGGGPTLFRGPNVNPRVENRMREIARMHEIGFQECALGRAAPNDSNALQLARAGVATGLVGIPNRYMHSAVEIVNYRDLDRSADLLARFLESVTEEDDWTP